MKHGQKNINFFLGHGIGTWQSVNKHAFLLMPFTSGKCYSGLHYHYFCTL